MIAASPHRSNHPRSGPDRFIGSFDELSDDEFLQRIALSLRKEAREREALRLDVIAARIAALRQLVREPS